MTKRWNEHKTRLAADAMPFETRHVFGALTILDTFRTYKFRRYDAGVLLMHCLSEGWW